MPDIAKLLAAGLGGQTSLGFRTMTLVRVTPGTRTPGAEIDGTNPTTANYTCKAFINTRRSGYWQFWQNAQAGTTARTRFVSIGILGGTLADGIEPRAGDRIVDGSTTYTIEPTGVTVDPVQAMFECVCRAPGA